MRGKRVFRWCCSWSGSDHPRACGENILSGTTRLCRRGSPPRMRGKLRNLLTIGNKKRITPAHAGKTRISSGRLATKADHPRACGENSEDIWAQILDKRITPAHAGKTTYKIFDVKDVSDHPRACGENLPFTLGGILLAGSPPRMRGKPHDS